MSIDTKTVFLNSDLINIHHDDEVLKCTDSKDNYQHPPKKLATNAPDLQSNNLYMQGEFIVIQGPNRKTAFPIKIGQSIRVGSSANADVLLTDVGISRVHFHTFWENQRLFICDDNSTNGTKVNDKRISSPTEIKGGDTISIGLKTVINFNEFISENRRSKHERRLADENLSNMERRKLPDRRNCGLNAHEMQVTVDQFVDLFAKYFDS